MILHHVLLDGDAQVSVSLHHDARVIISAGSTVSAMIHLSLAEAAQVRDALAEMLTEATPADVHATVTLSDAEEAMERR
jgi:hypothetical protein